MPRVGSTHLPILGKGARGKVDLDYSDTVADFEEDAGLRRLMVDHVNDKDLSEFILAGTHSSLLLRAISGSS